MNRVIVNFQIFHDDHTPIDNNTIYQVRRQIALLMENSEFGRVVEDGSENFRNVFARPLIDRYYNEENGNENELYVSYTLLLPLQHGNLGFLLIQNLPVFFRIIRNDYNLNLIVRTVYF